MFFQRTAGWWKAAEQILPTHLGVLSVKKVAGSGESRYRREGVVFENGEEEWYRVSF